MSFQPKKNSNLLDIKVKNYGECSWCVDEDNKESLCIPWVIWTRWLFLSQQMGNKEWGGVFWVKDGIITEFKIPQQEVTSVACEFKEELGGNGIVHSHHNMDAFHSADDDRFARNVYEYSIVLSNKGTYEATKKVKLPCGSFGYLKLELKLLEAPEDIDLTKITPKQEFSAPPAKEDKTTQVEQTEEFEEGLSCEYCFPYRCRCGEAFGSEAPPAGWIH